jgi:hypothetical protein
MPPCTHLTLGYWSPRNSRKADKVPFGTPFITGACALYVLFVRHAHYLEGRDEL